VRHTNIWMLQALHHSNFSAHLVIIKQTEHYTNQLSVLQTTDLQAFQGPRSMCFTNILAFLNHPTYPWLIHIIKKTLWTFRLLGKLFMFPPMCLYHQAV